LETKVHTSERERTNLFAKILKAKKKESTSLFMELQQTNKQEQTHSMKKYHEW